MAGLVEFLEPVDEEFSITDPLPPTNAAGDEPADDAAQRFEEYEERQQDDTAQTIADAFKDKRRRPRKAAEYERKALAPIRALARKLAGKSSTKPDAAALLITGPTIAQALGDIAADNPNVARLLDFGSETTDSPAAKLTGELVTLVTQVIRNHEDAVAPGAERVVTVRGGRTFRLPRWFGVRLPSMYRDMFTDDPDILAVNVFTNERIQKITADWYVAE